MKLLKLFILFIGILLLLFSNVSAKFVCGEVLDSDDEMSASWYDVGINYSSFYNSCKVNPEEKKFCCDADLDKNQNSGNWKMGETVTSEIINSETGYVAGPVELIFTSSAYDIFPQMKLKKAIKINSPIKKVFLRNNTNIEFNVSFLEGTYNQKINGDVVSTENNSYLQNKTLEFGVNNVLVESELRNRNFKENIEFVIIENFSVLREISCDVCSSNKMHTNREVTVNLNIKFSHEVINFTIKEYLPRDFNIINNNDGVLGFGSTEYNTISWTVSGKNISLNYSFFSSNKSQEYYIASYLEDLFLEEEKYISYTYLKPVIRGRGGGRSKRDRTENYVYVPATVSIVKPNLPLVAQNKSLRVAVYSEKELGEGFVYISESEYNEETYNRYLEFVEGYSINSNLVGDNFNSMSFELKLNQSELKNKNLEDFEVYGITREGRHISFTGYSISEGKINIESNEFLDSIFIFGIKKELNTWDKILEFFWRTFSVDRVWQ